MRLSQLFLALSFSLVLSTLTTTNAVADETWDTPDGTMVYLDDVQDLAIWEIDGEHGLVRIYLPGLGGNFDNRSVHDGLWLQRQNAKGQRNCVTSMTGPDGHTGEAWGRVRVVFHSSGFPTNWTMLRGQCFEEPRNPLFGQSPLLD